MKFKLGKRPPRKHLSTPAFGDFITRTALELPQVQARGWEYALPNNELNILGNDQYGNCAEAGMMHLLQTQAANQGVKLTPTLEETLALYSAVTGFNPADPSSDQGTDLLSLLQYAKANGIMIGGQKVKVLGWAALDLSSVAQIRYANYIFGGTYLGINCPQSAEDNTANWTYQPQSPSQGGHCINGTGQGAAGMHIQSWGLNIPATWEFLLHNLDEGYAVITDVWLDKQDLSPGGLDLANLQAAISVL